MFDVSPCQRAPTIHLDCSALSSLSPALLHDSRNAQTKTTANFVFANLLNQVMDDSTLSTLNLKFSQEHFRHLAVLRGLGWLVGESKSERSVWKASTWKCTSVMKLLSRVGKTVTRQSGQIYWKSFLTTIKHLKFNLQWNFVQCDTKKTGKSSGFYRILDLTDLSLIRVNLDFFVIEALVMTMFHCGVKTG